MGRAVFCDRCGEVGKIVETVGILSNLGWRTLDGGGPSADDPLGQSEPILLCPKCFLAFKQFMNSSA